MRVRVRERPLRVPGFRFAGIACGIKSRGRRDLALIHTDVPATVAGVFTQNRVRAIPVELAARHVRRGRAQAILINSGNANACAGAAGERVARAACLQTAIALGIPVWAVLPCSTGKIGVPLPAVPMVRGIAKAVRGLRDDRLWHAARAMMTTDAFPKVALRRVRIGGRLVTVAGLAKGAGMIAPDMATLLVCLLTDAAVPAPALRGFLGDAVATSFNAITVDGDMSTNDTVIALANGYAGNRPLGRTSADGRRFGAALAAVARELADYVVADGEGATKRVRIAVRGARSARAAQQVARAIAGSLLVKTALYGGDPNWGRIVCAAGYAGVPVRLARMTVRIGNVSVLRRGVPVPGDAERRAARVMRRPAFTVGVDLGSGGSAEAVVTTSDLSPAYVRFNSAYST